MDMFLASHIGTKDIKQESNRKGFGRGLLSAGQQNNQVVALCADLTESTQMESFAKAFPDRYIEVGIAEQNLVTVGSGMAAMGKVPFVSSYAAFCPGRCWEQIRTTIALNDRPVKIVGSHAGVSVGPDGATHQVLEDIALMRVMPNMVVIAPGDSIEAEKATVALANNGKPTYLRLSRADSAVFTTADTPFEIGKAYVLREGGDVTIMSTGTMTYQALVAAHLLALSNIHAEIVHVPTIKPLDIETIINSAHKTGRVVTVEEAQIAGGFGSAIAELLSEQLPMPVMRIGMQDRFGESGEPNQLLDHFGLMGEHIATATHDWMKHTPQYHR
ncbi:MAG TPA: transketolase C-terminal domain-containing protein [Candidatus Saccharimonadales bacterium]|nr:transketolase C-terminal domain-containing protein [Candidatus Saccharimonadales bacterium]